MATVDSYQWDRKIGVCLKHMLPSVPCPACLAAPEIDTDMYLVLEPIERWLPWDEVIIPVGFDPTIHDVH